MPWIQMAALIETPHYSVTQSLSQEPSAVGQARLRGFKLEYEKKVCLFVTKVMEFCIPTGSQWGSYAVNTNGSINWNPSLLSRYRTIFLKRFIQGLVFKGILKGQESKSWDFFEGPRRFRGPQKSEKFNFSKRTNLKL